MFYASEIIRSTVEQYYFLDYIVFFIFECFLSLPDDFLPLVLIVLVAI